MTNGTLIAYLSQSLFLPPGVNLLLALAAWILWKSWRRTARTLLLISTASLYALATPTISFELIHTLQDYPALSLKDIKKLEKTEEETNTAIVVLGGGRRNKAPEFADTDTVNHFTLERLRYAAYLHKKTRQPLLVSGGSPEGQPTPEAVMMNQVLSEAFNAPVQWLEPQGENTAENAEFSKQLLERNGITRIILVTHSWHMPRATQAFQSEKLEIIPAPTGHIVETYSQSLNYFPSAQALAQSVRAIREQLGSLWLNVSDF